MKLSVICSTALFLSYCTACHPQYQECPCSHHDLRKRFYSQVLTEIVEHRFYSDYLPSQPAVDLQHPLNSNDSADQQMVRYNRQLIISQNQLFNDTAHFKTLYLDTTSRRQFSYAMHDYGCATCNADKSWRDFITQAGLHPQNMTAAVDSLCALQHLMAPQDFQTCTFRVRLAKAAQKHEENEESMGVVYLSDAIFDTRQQLALLTYDYHCGGRCGFTEAVVVENRGNRWRIKQAVKMSMY